MSTPHTHNAIQTLHRSCLLPASQPHPHHLLPAHCSSVTDRSFSSSHTLAGSCLRDFYGLFSYSLIPYSTPLSTRIWSLKSYRNQNQPLHFTVPHTKTTITKQNKKKQKQKFYGKIYKTLTIPPNLLPPQVIHSFISLRPSSTYKACSQLASVEWLAQALLLRGFPSYSHSLLPLQPHTLPFWQYPTLLKLRVHGSLHQSIPWNKIPVSLWIANA